MQLVIQMQRQRNRSNNKPETANSVVQDRRNNHQEDAEYLMLSIDDGGNVEEGAHGEMLIAYNIDGNNEASRGKIENNTH